VIAVDGCCQWGSLILNFLSPEGAILHVTHVVQAVFDNLALVATSEPNERLPKEEQIRCCIYATIQPQFRVVCAERGYASIDEGSGSECDLWASSSERVPMWLEGKRCWSVSGWNNKPSEQLRDWETDLNKLRKVPVTSERYFLLVGFFDFNPDNEKTSHSGVVQNIRQFYVGRLVYSNSQKFAWRTNDGITWVGAWVWHWPPGTVVEG
jgi:hypothetical protein